MRLYFDTEFTGLHKNTTLISLGIVSDDGKMFYAEFMDYDETQCDQWIRENVLANLAHRRAAGSRECIGKIDKAEIKRMYDFREYIIGNENIYYCLGNKNLIKEYLLEWLKQFGQLNQVELISDVCHYDMVLLIDIFGDAFSLPYCLPAACHDLNSDIARYCGVSENEAFNKSREEMLELFGAKIDFPEGFKHNSLYDALVIKEIFQSILI